MRINAIENYYNLVNMPLEIGSGGFCAIVREDGMSPLLQVNGSGQTALIRCECLELL